MGRQQCRLMFTALAANPFQTQYPHTNSPHWSPYIPLRKCLREFAKRSKYFPSGDHFVNSHNLFSCLCVEIVWRQLTLVTLGLRRVACVAGVERDIGVGREEKGPYSLQHFCPSRPPSPPLYVLTTQATWRVKGSSTFDVGGFPRKKAG